MMRALLEGRRQGSVGIVLALFALLCLLGSSLGLTVAYRTQVNQFKQYVHEQCISRLSYDASSQATRRQSRIYYQHQIENERNNHFIDGRLRAQRVADAEAMVKALDDTLSKTVPGGCNRYR